jgi:hypothetical protein
MDSPISSGLFSQIEAGVGALGQRLDVIAGAGLGDANRKRNPAPLGVAVPEVRKFTGRRLPLLAVQVGARTRPPVN